MSSTLLLKFIKNTNILTIIWTYAIISPLGKNHIISDFVAMKLDINRVIACVSIILAVLAVAIAASLLALFLWRKNNQLQEQLDAIGQESATLLAIKEEELHMANIMNKWLAGCLRIMMNICRLPNQTCILPIETVTDTMSPSPAEPRHSIVMATDNPQTTLGATGVEPLQNTVQFSQVLA